MSYNAAAATCTCGIHRSVSAAAVTGGDRCARMKKKACEDMAFTTKKRHGNRTGKPRPVDGLGCFWDRAFGTLRKKFFQEVTQ
ncbi:hypothetical protein J8I26_20300 [Herbaspirillum sp. LeCh32-8]|uniref:hypothetical protein n=1 Tax=Herbaspirillum sp. LeCh32-8 TaxID=2821356 RepID=UPI001AE30092|nr:hypothetical protein [Herbaspirillum sp. LeCh32-8]MBP0600464.1 hypothetical protein [Herbaspirillum sp. LeCh32-8]